MRRIINRIVWDFKKVIVGVFKKVAKAIDPPLRMPVPYDGISAEDIQKVMRDAIQNQNDRIYINRFTPTKWNIASINVVDRCEGNIEMTLVNGQVHYCDCKNKETLRKLAEANGLA